MNTKFSSVPVESDTQVLAQTEAKLGNYDVLYQQWYWDGITAESFIFDSSDIAELSDEKLESTVRESALVNPGTSVTIKRAASGYTFVNFNFAAE